MVYDTVAFKPGNLYGDWVEPTSQYRRTRACWRLLATLFPTLLATSLCIMNIEEVVLRVEYPTEDFTIVHDSSRDVDQSFLPLSLSPAYLYFLPPFHVQLVWHGRLTSASAAFPIYTFKRVKLPSCRDDSKRRWQAPLVHQGNGRFARSAANDIRSSWYHTYSGERRHLTRNFVTPEWVRYRTKYLHRNTFLSLPRNDYHPFNLPPSHTYSLSTNSSILFTSFTLHSQLAQDVGLEALEARVLDGKAVAIGVSAVSELVSAPNGGQSCLDARPILLNRRTGFLKKVTNMMERRGGCGIVRVWRVKSEDDEDTMRQPSSPPNSEKRRRSSEEDARRAESTRHARPTSTAVSKRATGGSARANHWAGGDLEEDGTYNARAQLRLQQDGVGTASTAATRLHNLHSPPPKTSKLRCNATETMENSGAEARSAGGE
ncbi:hypothetical protein FA95DRAFT_1578743 [Auriscalpium vulgare]|uniref:Uncharacterized protein n=1 Tax=Auriscalpium vulgare TaxID=40419 RepID=A0ACB8R1U0_9AGAM|nr:hypothetical protein FA95DRAFT_1578743 [Auriscalpium vulgare]